MYMSVILTGFREASKDTFLTRTKREDGSAELACRLLTAFALLRQHQPARRGQKEDAELPLRLHPLRLLADDLVVRAGVVHQDEPVRVHLRQKVPHLLLADVEIGVAEEQV